MSQVTGGSSDSGFGGFGGGSSNTFDLSGYSQADASAATPYLNMTQNFTILQNIITAGKIASADTLNNLSSTDKQALQILFHTNNLSTMVK